MDTGYGQSRLLGAGGLTELDERVYRQLLASNGASMSDLGEAVGASPRRVRYALEALEQAGLVSRAGNRPVRYVPAPPEAAVEMLVARRQEETERLRLAAKALAQEYQAGQAAASFREVVETIAPGEAGVNRQYQLLMGAKQELLSFNRRPKRPDQRFIDFKLSILERGVVARGIYTPEALEVPGVVDFIEAVGRVGEHSRVVNGLPTHLLVVDRRVGFTPLEAGRGPLLGGSLILHESPLLDALVAFFECVWNQATPVELWDDTKASSHNGQSMLSAEDHKLLSLLATGMKDGAIAQQMGLVTRTAERRLGRIMERLGTRTRFQTAVEACRRGWLGRSETGEANSKR